MAESDLSSEVNATTVLPEPTRRYPTDPLLYYPFESIGDGLIDDESGNNIDGTVFGGSSTQGLDGTDGYFLDGNDDYGSVPDSELPSLSGAITVSVWVKFEALGGRNQTFIGKRDSSDNTEFAFRLNTDGKTLDWYWQSFEVHSVTVNPSTNVWHHCLATRDSDSWSIWFDGAEVASGSSSSLGFDADVDLGIGSYSGDSVEEQLYGTIEELRIYPRVLSDSEITDLYQSPTPRQLATKSGGDVKLNWQNNDDSIDGGIDVERSTDNFSTVNTVASGLSILTTSYTDTTVSSGETYEYRIERNTDHATAVSNTTDITT